MNKDLDGKEVLSWEEIWSGIITRDPWETVTALPGTLGTLMKSFTDPSFSEEKGGGAGAGEAKKELKQDFFVQASTFIQSIFPSQQQNYEVPSSTKEEGNPSVIILSPPFTDSQKSITESEILQSSNPIIIQPAQSKQEQIKQQLEAKINEGAPTGIEATPEKIFEHKVKNLYAIFSELKYQRIDEILQKTTSTTYTPRDKIDEVKKFQNKFKLDLPIDTNDKLERALNHLSSDIATENLNYDSTALSSTKFTPTSYNQTELKDHLNHSEYYLDGILGADEIGAGKRIEAAKLFVSHLGLVCTSPNQDIANKHKQFVKFQEEKDSRDVTKIVAEGTKFAKSIEDLTSGDKIASFLGTDGRVSNQSDFHNSVVNPEVNQRDLVIRKFQERLSGLSSVLESSTVIDKKTTDKIFKDSEIKYEISTNKITFTDPVPAAPAGAGAPAGGGAGAGATAGGGAGGATAGVAPANPLTDISFVGLSKVDILSRSLYLRYAIEGIMEAEGEDKYKKKAINILIEEMKITTDPKYSAQNVCYNDHIKNMTQDKNGNILHDSLKTKGQTVLDSDSKNKALIEKNLKKIGAELLKRVASEKTETVLMSNLAMEEIYANAGLNLKTPIIDDNSMSIKTTMGNEDIRKYIKAVQEFQQKEIKVILGKTTGTNAEKTQEIQAILNLSLTYDEASSELKIKTTRGNLDKIEGLKAVAKDDNTLLREDSRLMQSYFSNLYQGALTTKNVDDDQKILGLKAINAINSVANFDRNFMDFKKIKDPNAKDNAITSGQAITTEVKAESFDENGNLKTSFSWNDAGEINQEKLKTLYAEYLEKEKEKEKEKAGDEGDINPRGAIWSCLTWRCFRSGKQKELTEEEEKERKTALLKLVDIKLDNKTSKIEETTEVEKGNIFYRITKATMDDILTNGNSKNQLESLKKLMNLKTDSVDNFFDDFSKNPNLKVPDTANYSINTSINASSNSTNYFQKFCQAILDSGNKNEINDDKKLEALKLFLAEQNNKSFRIINKEIADGNPTDKEINTKAQAFLVEVSKMEKGGTVYSDV